MVTVQFAGSGDTFGIDGRFEACISLRWQQSHVFAGLRRFVADCAQASPPAQLAVTLPPVGAAKR
jgi:hypothetical protein